MSEFVGGNRLTLLHNGAEFFPALESAIDAATQWVYLESYICVDDAVGQGIAAALIRAARRGVATHLLLDGFGSKNYSPKALHNLRAAGVQAFIYRPHISPFRFFRQRLRRLHRKLAVIDERYAFVGGINLLDDAIYPGARPRFDFAVRVEGPLVAPIFREVSHLHQQVSRSQAQRLETETAPDLAAIPAVGDTRAAFVVRSNLQHRREIERVYLRAIARAKTDILIANAYFLPGRRFRKVLKRAAARGVRVRLLLQGYSDHLLVQFASRGLYDQLLEAGIEIYEYQASELHAKVAVIDETWATVGSSNIDPLSLMLSREANVVITDSAFAQELCASLIAAMTQDARAITPDTWRRRPRLARILSGLTLGMVRLMAGWVGYGIAE